LSKKGQVLAGGDTGFGDRRPACTVEEADREGGRDSCIEVRIAQN